MQKYNLINENSTSRILKHLINKDETLAVISTYRSERSEEKNKSLLKELKSIAKKFGFTEFIARWSETNPETNDVESSDERSLMIFNIPLQDAIQLGAKYNQSSIIYKDGVKLAEVCTVSFTSFDGKTFKPGQIVRIFSTNDKQLLNLDLAKKIFSKEIDGPASMPIKGSGKKRAFTLQELNEVEQPRAAYFQKNENILK